MAINVKRIGKRIVLFITYTSAIGLLLSYLSTYVNPNSISWLAFFGLLYPVFLFLNVFILIYWLIKRRKKLFIPLVALLIGLTHLSHFIQFTVFDINKEEKTTEVKMMSYNVRSFDLYNWTENKTTRSKIFDFLRGEKPEIIAFQEFYKRDNNRSWEFKTLDTLIKILHLPHTAEGYTTKTTKGENFGLCTFSKYPILQSELVKFDNDKTNSFLWTDVYIGSDTIRVYNAHIGSARFELEDYQAIGTEGNHKTWPHVPSMKEQKIIPRLQLAYQKRALQTQQLIKHTQASPYPVVVMGDFNDTPVSYNYRQITQHLYDAFTVSGNGIAGTYCKLPFLRIDYILHSDFFNSFAYQTHPEVLSDHRAISTVIEF